MTLDAPKLDGTTARVQLLRPTFWLTLQRATVGNTLYIAVPECGIQGDATLLQIDDCPPIKPRPGPGFQIVTGTYRHEAAQTLDISIEGESKPIGTTPNHPIWSVDRQAFVRADSLTVGERLQTLTGMITVTKISPRGPPEPVYNLEVQVKHTYYVADSGVLVHNGAPCPKEEVLYRTMSEKHFKRLQKTGRIPGTGETSTSPTLEFAQNYRGVTVRLELEPGTLKKLEKIGVSDGSLLAKQQFPEMIEGIKGWNKNYARFKTETLKPDGIQQINIQLGNGDALDILNDNLKKWIKIGQ